MDSREKKQITRQSTSQTENQSKRSPFVIIGTIVILVIVVIAFVFVPAIEAAVSSSSEPSLTFGSYDGEEIKLAAGNYFADRINTIRQNLSPEQLSDFFVGVQIHRQAFEDTVAHTAKIKEMENAGFIIPNSVVDKEIINLPDLQENGVFSPRLYQSVPNDQKMLLWNSMRDQLISGTYDQSLGNLRVSTKELEFINSINNTTRNFEIASLPIALYPDSEVRSYAESNPDLFKQVHLSVVTISSSEREANNLLESIKNGTTSFEDAARNSSIDSYAETGGDMGLKIAYELNTEIPEESRQSVVSLANGALSSVIKVPRGWAFYRMNEAAQDIDLYNADNLVKVRGYIQGYERGRMENWLIERAEAFIADARANGFDAAVSTASYEGFSSSSFGPVPLNYGDIEFIPSYFGISGVFPTISSFNIAELSQAGSNINFWTHAFKTPVNTVSDPIIVGNYVVILYPTSETSGSEASETSSIDFYYTSWLSLCVNQAFANQVLQSDKFIDNFNDTYIGLLQ